MKKLAILGVVCFGVMAFVISPKNKTIAKKAENAVSKKENPAADSYKVIKVNGQIIYVKTGSSMKMGDEFAPTTSLKFATAESRAAIISRIKGRFILTQGGSGDRSNLLPAMNNISSRAGALLNIIDLQNHFQGNYVILGRMALTIGQDAFPMDNDHFFYLRFDYDGESINKKLPVEEGKLVLDRKDIFKIDDKAIDGAKIKEMTLYYRDNAKKTSTKINSFNPVFPDIDLLKDELKIIIAEYSDKDSDKKKSEITSYINEFYGKPDKDNLAEFLEKEFQL
ncbi:MAG: hypothetical protein R2799_02675 [Crocinitomicaceae bacterium]